MSFAPPRHHRAMALPLSFCMPKSDLPFSLCRFPSMLLSVFCVIVTHSTDRPVRQSMRERATYSLRECTKKRSRGPYGHPSPPCVGNCLLCSALLSPSTRKQLSGRRTGAALNSHTRQHVGHTQKYMQRLARTHTHEKDSIRMIGWKDE